MKRVLVFPPLLKRYRYLLHELTRIYFGHTLSTISVGEEGKRSPLIYFKSLNNSIQMSNEENKYIDDNLSELQLNVEYKSDVNDDKHYNKNAKHRRPDMKLYVPPKAKSGPNIVSDNITPVDDKSFAQTKCESIVDDFAELDITNSSHDESKTNSFSDLMESGLHDIYSINEKNLLEKNESEIKDKNCDLNEGICWDNLFDENGDCVDSEFVKSVNSSLSVKNSDLKLQKSKINYYNFTPHEPDIDDSQFGHVLEVYDFPSELKTQHIITALSVYNCCRDFDIKWVDDTHALVVFSNQNSASEALKAIYPNMRLRPLSQGIRDSKIKARKCAEFLRPYKQRPETSASLARRLVTGALGLKVKLTPEERAAEKKKLEMAKEKRRQTIKQGHDVWEGNVE